MVNVQTMNLAIHQAVHAMVGTSNRVAAKYVPSIFNENFFNYFHSSFAGPVTPDYEPVIKHFRRMDFGTVAITDRNVNVVSEINQVAVNVHINHGHQIL